MIAFHPMGRLWRGELLPETSSEPSSIIRFRGPIPIRLPSAAVVVIALALPFLAGGAEEGLWGKLRRLPCPIVKELPEAPAQRNLSFRLFQDYA